MNTKERLSSLKYVEAESYENVILRLIDYVVEHVDEAAIKPNAERMLRERIAKVKDGDVMSTKQLLNELKKEKTHAGLRNQLG